MKQLTENKSLEIGDSVSVLNRTDNWEVADFPFDAFVINSFLNDGGTYYAVTSCGSCCPVKHLERNLND